MNTNDDTNRKQESADAEKVDSAIEALAAGNIRKAESLLMKVIENTPAEVKHIEQDGEGLLIKFWDQTEFIHYVTWQQEKGEADRSIKWVGNAYPRAHYYMGFICVKQKQYERAIDFLERGQALEPTNPKFHFEKAQALVHLGRKEEALELYDHAADLGPHVSGHDLALGRRGRGFVLIELGDLDGAEAAFKSSLELEPDNRVALNELQYIQHLRQGGATTSAQSVPSADINSSECAVCGKQFEKGIVVSIEGIPVSICERCERKLTKKWWQFWK